MKTFIVAALVLTLTSVAVATTPTNESPCSEKLKACFASSGLQRSNCFYTTGRDTVCAGSELGKLILERWSYAVDSTSSGQTHPGLLGESLIDETCLGNCDTKWLSQLLTGATYMDEIRSCLAACQSNNAIDTLHP